MPIPSSVHIIERGINDPPPSSDIESGFISSPVNNILNVPDNINVPAVKKIPFLYSLVSKIPPKMNIAATMKATGANNQPSPLPEKAANAIAQNIRKIP